MTYNKFQETIHGQYIQQIKTTKLNYWDRPITYWDLFPRISIRLSPQSEKKWLKNQTDLEENTYNSPQFVYYKDANTLVLVVKTNIEITPPMPKSWSDNDEDTKRHGGIIHGSAQWNNFKSSRLPSLL